MEVTWIAILASLCMGIGAGFVFVFAVKRNYFHDLENAKYQVFWSDLEDLVKLPRPGGVVQDDNESRQTKS